MLLLQAFRRLLDSDSGYHLHFAGYFRDDMLEAYVREAVLRLGLAGAVRFDGWQEDLPAWLADKSCIISGAIAESDEDSVLEAMAMGLRPIIHVSPGAAELYGEENLFATPEDFCRLVLAGPGDRRAYRQLIAQRHPMERLLRAADEVLRLMERDLASSGPSADSMSASADGCGSYDLIAPPKAAAAGKGDPP